MEYGVHWFRRDLRIAGNPALQWNWKKHAGRVLGVFCFDKKFLGRSDFSPARFQFFMSTLSELRDELRLMGSDLLFLDEGPDSSFIDLLGKLKHPPSTWTWNRDYEPFARERDRRIEMLLQKSGVSCHSERDHLLIEPLELSKGDDPAEGYQVFTPFSKKWLALLTTDSIQSRLSPFKSATTYLNQLESGKVSPIFNCTWKDVLKTASNSDELLNTYLQTNKKRVDIEIPAAGSLAAWRQLKSFRKKIEDYELARDIPSLDGTSRFSIFLKNGSLNVGQILHTLELAEPQRQKSRAKFLSEPIWREFYYSILYRHPQVEGTAFLNKFANIRWENRDDWFEAWKTGHTGFPIVDAGMRQLNTTGWMHNRVRMIVASFLTKDLLIDWKWGEKYFMEKLLDGDLAPNNGGWQWAASTGCDPQPYFRIFNPLLQSKRFDPKGEYIRQYVPELRQLSDRDIHEPPALERGEYPAPIVDHSAQREKALKLYKT